MAGKMVHVEIPVDDTAAARTFWGGLFGYEFQAFDGAPSEYHMFRTSEDTGGAISEEPGKRGLRVYFDCDDINASAAKVNELGGTAGEPMPVPGMGWFSVCTDDAGNEFGLWQHDTSASMPG